MAEPIIGLVDVPSDDDDVDVENPFPGGEYELEKKDGSCPLLIVEISSSAFLSITSGSTAVRSCKSLKMIGTLDFRQLHVRRNLSSSRTKSRF